LPSEAVTRRRLRPVVAQPRTPREWLDRWHTAPRQVKRRDGSIDPVWPSADIELTYRRRLLALIDEMARSLEYWIRVAYRATPPRVAELMALDASPAVALRRALRRLGARWRARFDRAALELAAYFGTAVAQRGDAQLGTILRRAGISVRWTMSAPMRDAQQAIVAENVALIRSIPRHQLDAVEGLVMRSVSTGRDLHQLTTDLRAQFGVTRRRAALIARDQSNKATGALQRVRQVELGISRAVWLHSHAGKVPRRTHVAMHGKEYEIARGMWDADEQRWVHPGELINCRCVNRPLLPLHRAQPAT